MDNTTKCCAESILETRELSYKYGNHYALEKCSIAIKQGDFVGFLGGNGAGKSTLFLNLNGVLTPTAGSIHYKGEKVAHNKAGLDFLRRHVGLVFQDPNVQLFNATCRKDIAFGLWAEAEDVVNEKVENVAKMLGVTHLLDRPPHALSFGQKKRIALAGVLVMEPDVIILDEPTAGLDPHGVSSILDILKQLKTKMTVLLSTHDVDMIPLYCDYCYVLDNGKIALCGTPKEALTPEIRKFALRLPRLTHLMEIMNKRDGVDVDIQAATISEVRRTLNEKLNACDVKRLRTGFTTGAVACAAVCAGCEMLFSGEMCKSVSVALPNGASAAFPVDNIDIGEIVVCSVRKDAGDDPDVTNGVDIFAKISRNDGGINIKGGTGIGVVTKKGLSVEVGNAAINPVPYENIRQNVAKILDKYGEKGVDVEISAPDGVRIAQHTFNPRLGIEGGISILGTTGIVEPMSEKALIDTIKLEICQRYAYNPLEVALTFGNIGQTKETEAVKCSNFLGAALDCVKALGFESVKVVGHVGKLVKVAGGIMNTHSSVADCRMEILALYSGLAGAETDVMCEILGCTTTAAALDVIEANKLDIWEGLTDKIRKQIANRVGLDVDKVTVVMFK